MIGFGVKVICNCVSILFILIREVMVIGIYISGLWKVEIMDIMK